MLKKEAKGLFSLPLGKVVKQVKFFLFFHTHTLKIFELPLICFFPSSQSLLSLRGLESSCFSSRPFAVSPPPPHCGHHHAPLESLTYVKCSEWTGFVVSSWKRVFTGASRRCGGEDRPAAEMLLWVLTHVQWPGSEQVTSPRVLSYNVGIITVPRPWS